MLWPLASDAVAAGADEPLQADAVAAGADVWAAEHHSQPPWAAALAAWAAGLQAHSFGKGLLVYHLCTSAC